MPRARKNCISLSDTPYYHCICRCVRRAFLWGKDKVSGQDFSHRKQWVIDRLSLLTNTFAVEVCAYAVMSNHYHVILHVNQQQALDWTTDEVIERWAKLFGLPVLVKRHLSKDAISQAERDKALEIIATWRERLHDISWFMRCLNEPLAREANKEDNCTGRFWEGRFKSQALLDEAGLLTCMAYVDLNPIRAGIEKTLENSDFTSIQQRVKSYRKSDKTNPRINNDTNAKSKLKLKAFHSPHQQDEETHIPFVFEDYLALVDWSGRAIIKGKRGQIDSALPPILQRLNIDADIWEQMMKPKGNLFKQAIGRIDSLRLYAQRQKQAWCHGLKSSVALFSSS